MIFLLKNIFRKLLPEKVKKAIRVSLVNISYLFVNSRGAFSDYKKAAHFMLKHGMTMYPSEFSLKYRDIYKNTQVIKDEEGMKFVFHKEKKMYFPSKMNDLEISKLYQSLIIEQDPESPHVYEYKEHRLKKDNIVFDIGAAEGIFILEHIDDIKHAYLFESDAYWIESLKKTFSPWANKVTIISKYVSNQDTVDTITLDTFIETVKCKVDFIKMDIEGAEIKALEGAKHVLLNSDIRLSICAYHKSEHAYQINEILQGFGYDVKASNRLMYLGDIKHPAFRLGMLYANSYSN